MLLDLFIICQNEGFTLKFLIREGEGSADIIG
jgi:hypothetical protein